MRILVAGLIVSAGSLLAAAQEPTRITSASNVRLRASPSENAAVVASLPLGTDLVQLETGGEGATWTRVRTAVGQDGWIPTRLTRSLVTSRRTDVLASIIHERLARKGDAFAPRAELVNLVERATKETSEPEAAGRFALDWVRALSSALEIVPMGRGTQPPYKDWLAARKDAVVYNEPGGRWMIRPDRLWKLHDDHARTSSADELAWAAVLNGVPGECEGFLPCHLQRRNRLEGEYLRRSALGSHVEEAVSRIADEVAHWPVPLAKPYFFDPAKDCGELVQALDPLRAALATTRTDRLQSVVGKLDKLKGVCRN